MASSEAALAQCVGGKTRRLPGSAILAVIILAAQAHVAAVADSPMNDHQPLSEFALTYAIEAIEQSVLARCVKNPATSGAVEQKSIMQPCWVSPHKHHTNDSGYIPFGFATTKDNLVKSVLIYTSGVRFQNRDFKTLTKILDEPKETKEAENQNLYGAKFMKLTALWVVPRASAHLFGNNRENVPIYVVFASCCEGSDPTLTEGVVDIWSQTAGVNPTLEGDD
jgi:hypothetical protein